MIQGLIVQPREKWIAKAVNAGEPLTFVHRDTESALQFSVATYRGPEGLVVTGDGLLGVCRKVVRNLPNGQEIYSNLGDCRFGIFATVTVEAPAPKGEPIHLQAWALSNGKAFLLVTHTCDVLPDAEETAEASEIALTTMLG